MHPMVSRARVLFAVVSLSSLGCGWSYTPTDNVLPDPDGGDSDTEGPAPPPDVGDTGEIPATPATYRLDCIDIQALGDADDSVFQVATLQNTWAADIANFRLNILIDVVSEDPDAGQATASIRSGIGGGWSDQCTEGATESSQVQVAYAPMAAQWEPSNEEDQCAQAGNGGDSSGTYILDLDADEFVYIYAESDDSTVLNCSLTDGAPNAIPILGASSTFSMSEDRSSLAGTLTGCMSEAGGLQICSCLAVCSGNAHPDCDGCPAGAVPLGLLLGGIGTTSHCSDLLGEPAFDITLEFTAQRLGAVPTTCG